MITDISLGQFFPGNSPVHRLDPRTKILWTVLFMVMVFVINTLTGYVILGLLTFLVIKLTGVPLRFYFKGLKPLLFLMVFTGVINLFLTEGNVIYTLPYLGWTITDSGVRLAVFMILRLMFLITGTSVLTFTTSPISLTDGIEKLLSPFRKIGLPAGEIAMMMSIALRFIPTLLEETDKIMKAQKSRGADFESGGLIHRAKALIPILVPLFISAFRRADELAIAMECRCYRGGAGRTSLKKLVFHRRDGFAAVYAVLFVGLVILCNFMGEIWQILS